MSEPRAFRNTLICPRQVLPFQPKSRVGASTAPSVLESHSVSPRHMAACQAFCPPRAKHSAPCRVRRTDSRSPGASLVSIGPSTSAGPDGITVRESRFHASPIVSNGSFPGTPSGGGGCDCGCVAGGGEAVVSTGAVLGSGAFTGGACTVPGRGGGAQLASATPASSTQGANRRARLTRSLPV